MSASSSANADDNAYVALHPFQGDQSLQQLTFPAGAPVLARAGQQANNGWLWGSYQGQAGWIPSKYVTPRNKYATLLIDGVAKAKVAAQSTFDDDASGRSDPTGTCEGTKVPISSQGEKRKNKSKGKKKKNRSGPDRFVELEKNETAFVYLATVSPDPNDTSSDLFQHLFHSKKCIHLYKEIFDVAMQRSDIFSKKQLTQLGMRRTSAPNGDSSFLEKMTDFETANRHKMRVIATSPEHKPKSASNDDTRQPSLSSLAEKLNEKTTAVISPDSSTCFKHLTKDAMDQRKNEEKKMKKKKELEGCILVKSIGGSLDISGTDIGDTGAFAVAVALSSLRSNIRISIRLRNCSISCVGASFLARMVLENRLISVEILDLARNKIGNAGAHAIAKSLKNIAILKNLTLADNLFGADPIISLLENLKSNSTLKRLSIGKCKAVCEVDGNIIAEKLSEIISFNQALTHLMIPSCGITVQGAKQIAKSLEINNTLEILNISGILVPILESIHSTNENTVLTHL